jgi:membrane protein
MSDSHTHRPTRHGKTSSAPTGAGDRVKSPTGDRPSRADDAPANPRDGRGRKAETPLQINAAGWKDVLLRVKEEMKADNLSLVAAGVAFYFMLSLFPALIATVAVYGLVADPVTIEQQVAQLLALLPPDAGALIATQLREIGHGSEGGLGLSLAISVAVALWSASKGAKALIAGLNIAYEETEERGIVRQQIVALSMTFGFVFFAALSIGLIAVLPNITHRLPLGSLGTGVTFLSTWAVLAALVLGGLAAVYRYGPSRDNPRWQWVSAGSLVAGLLWLLASLGFSWYASRFGSFNETYGTLAGGVLLLLWLQITAWVTLFGAELNAEIEHQTAVDSTVGEPKPMGERDATMADTLGAALGAAERKRLGGGDGNGVRDHVSRATGRLARRDRRPGRDNLS